ncbi:MAG: Hsp20/alpha crystallin family protein [Candidatus Tyrphobacter sp.]
MDYLVRSRVSFEPNADVFVDDERGAVIVTVEVAGADPQSLRVRVDDERHLLIRGLRPRSQTRAGSFVQKEIAYGEFAKRVYLPVAVEFENAGATFSDGVLTIVLALAQTPYRPTERTEIHMIVKRVPV